MPTYAFKGRNRLNELVAGEKDAASQDELRALFRGLSGDRKTAGRHFRKLRAARLLAGRYVPAGQLCIAALGAGDRDGAVEWLREGAVVERDPNLVQLDLALQALAQIDSRKSRVVELRFFGGLSVEETALALDVSAETVHRDWRMAKAWLKRELRKEVDAGG